MANRYEDLQVERRRWARLLAVQGSREESAWQDPGQRGKAPAVPAPCQLIRTGGDAALVLVWGSAIMKSLCAWLGLSLFLCRLLSLCPVLPAQGSVAAWHS